MIFHFSLPSLHCYMVLAYILYCFYYLQLRNEVILRMKRLLRQKKNYFKAEELKLKKIFSDVITVKAAELGLKWARFGCVF